MIIFVLMFVRIEGGGTPHPFAGNLGRTPPTCCPPCPLSKSAYGLNYLFRDDLRDFEQFSLIF
jgi:hypothetical protein